MTLLGMCPECDYKFTADGLEIGETLACPECALSLQVRDITDGEIKLEMIETELPDWGQ
jgi:alpha-aminoadipate/glutamate carrier protein LysW